jgi:hypothetical protein
VTRRIVWELVVAVVATDNQQPSLVRGRFNDYPEREYTQVSGST